MKTQVPGIYQFELGQIAIAVLSDGTVPQDLYSLLTNTNQGKIDSLLHRSFLANPVETSINVFLINTGDKRVLVDTGAGELFGPKLGGRLQTSLKGMGCAPDEIDGYMNQSPLLADPQALAITYCSKSFPFYPLRFAMPT